MRKLAAARHLPRAVSLRHRSPMAKKKDAGDALTFLLKGEAAGGTVKSITVAVALLVMRTSCVAAQTASAVAEATPSTDDLKQLSLEQLMDVQVTSVARHPEKLLQAAAAIQVITREQIRRSGATTLAEALRLADNLEVAQKNSHDWGISARGFNTDLANKLLVMIDGRTVYTPLFSGVFWDAQDYLLEDVERIEVIGGPGGTLWGANAVNGIINIITRSAADTHGTYVEAGGGSQPQGLAGARYGGSLAPGVDFRVYAKYLDMTDQALASGASAGDAWHQGRGGFRLDAAPSQDDSLSVHGDFYSGREGQVPTGAASELAGGNLVGHWTHVFSEQSDLSLQSYYDRTHLAQPVAAVFLQDELRLGHTWSLILGSKLEHNDYTGYEVEPNVRLQWSVTPSQTLWSAISRAARTPSRVDRDVAGSRAPSRRSTTSTPISARRA
jgi:iron complex outermembrane recepter protein